MNFGFFDLPSTAKEKTPKGATGCEACGLFRLVKSPQMKVTGNGRLNSFILGEGPGGTEDRLNKQFVGEAGDKLRFHLRLLGYDLDEDFWKQNAVACRPITDKGTNRTPTSKEIKFCEPRWRAELNEKQPKFIFLLGGKAIETFFMHQSQPITHNLSVTRWRNLCIPDLQTHAWILPLFHPSFINRTPEAEPIFRKDLEWALNQLNRPSPTFIDYRKKITLLKQYQDVLTTLETILNGKFTIVFDYETSTLRPYSSGQNIWSIAVNIIELGLTYAFPFSYPSHWTTQQFLDIKNIWSKILTNPNIKKVAQNIQMERPWSKIIVGVDPQNWVWDTMVASHIIDERSEFTSLDFQVFINFGIEYGENISRFKNLKPGTNYNSMHEVPLDELLEYNGTDAYFTGELAKKQWELFNSGTAEAQSLTRAYNLFHEGILAFSDSEETGIAVNVPYYQDTKIDLEKRSEFLIRKINNSPENKIFKSKTNRNIISLENSKVSLSNDDLKNLLFKYLGLIPSKFTELGNISADHSVLEELDLPFSKDIVKIRQINKLKTTYVEGILNLHVEGRIHPNFNLHLVRTYRSSSSDPNFHNLPKRDKYSMELIRGGIIPSPGNCIIEADYGGHEIRIITCYSKDKVMIKELEQEHDIHGDWSEQLLQTDLKNKKDRRFDTKNAFVFAEIYGSYYKNVYKDLKERGYSNLTESHVHKVELDFWKRYWETKKFQGYLLDFYKENGFIEMFHGFRRRGFLGRNEIINTPVQGTAFHLLLWSYIRLNWLSKVEGWISKVIAQIHDSILIDAHPSEISYLVPLIKKVMTQDILEDHPWIIVPLVSEVEVTEIDKPWHTKKEYEEN
jgi:uracil-DNA glycosylase family 4